MHSLHWHESVTGFNKNLNKQIEKKFIKTYDLGAFKLFKLKDTYIFINF